MSTLKNSTIFLHIMVELNLNNKIKIKKIVSMYIMVKLEYICKFLLKNENIFPEK
jgi:hypothetical protein